MKGVVLLLEKKRKKMTIKFISKSVVLALKDVVLLLEEMQKEIDYKIHIDISCPCVEGCCPSLRGNAKRN